MKKVILGVAAGFVSWVIAVSVGNRLLRAGLVGYREVEEAMTFTQSMLVARLALGAVSSLVAGYVAAWVSGSSGVSAKALAGVLLAIFVPIHIVLWAKFPVWYHLVFLASLALLTLVGAKLSDARSK
jgi:hypothetical protein